MWGGDKPSPKENGFISRTAVDNRALGGVEQRDLLLARCVLNYAKLVFSLAQSFCFLRSVIRLLVNQSRLSRSAFWYTQDIYDCSRGASWILPEVSCYSHDAFCFLLFLERCDLLFTRNVLFTQCAFGGFSRVVSSSLARRMFRIAHVFSESRVSRETRPVSRLLCISFCEK